MSAYRAGLSGPQGDVLALQRAAGNRALERLLQSGAAKRQCAADGIPYNVQAAPDSGSGQPLELGVRGFMENRFGEDFSGVRVHTNEHAAKTAQQLNAVAYTIGRDIFFSAGQYQPQTQEGKRLLAHELTHVVQQASATQDASHMEWGPTDAVISSAESAFESEAQQMAERQGRSRPIVGRIALPSIQLKKRRSDSDEQSGTMQVRWSDDSGEFYRRLVNAVARHFGIREAALFQPLHAPALRFHSLRASDFSLQRDQRVRVHVDLNFDTGRSQVSDVRVEPEPIVRTEAAPVPSYEKAAETQARRPVEAREVLVVDEDSGRTYNLLTDSTDFAHNYVDNDITTADYWSSPFARQILEHRKFWVHYKDGRKLAFNLDDIPVRRRTVQRPGLIQVRPSFKAQKYFKRGGFIYPELYSQESTPTLVSIATTITLNHQLRESRLELSEVTHTFAQLISISVHGLSFVHQVATSPPIKLPIRGRAPKTSGTIPPEGGESRSSSRVHPEVEAEVEKAFKTLRVEDPHSGAKAGSESSIRAGVGVRVPASKTGEPAEVLEVGAGRQKVALGLPPERQLVAVTRSDIAAAKPDLILNAEQPIPKNLQGRFTAMIINNPYEYTPNIAELNKGLTSGGRIIVQGNWEANKWFRAVGKGEIPPGMRRTIERKLPPSAILGEGFRRTGGETPVLPNARITFEVVQ